MNPSELDRRFPVWLKATCCVVPLGGLLAVCVGIAFGNSVSSIAVLALTALSWKVIARVLGVSDKRFLIVLPRLARPTACTLPRNTGDG